MQTTIDFLTIPANHLLPSPYIDASLARSHPCVRGPLRSLGGHGQEVQGQARQEVGGGQGGQGEGRGEGDGAAHGGGGKGETGGGGRKIREEGRARREGKRVKRRLVLAH